MINFITKRSVQGVEATAEGVAPETKGGGESRFNLMAGMGDLEVDGFNVFGIVDWHRQNALKATDRDFSKTGVIPNRGLNKLSGNTGSANFYDATSGISGNFTRANGCDPTQNSYIRDSTRCGYDYTAEIDDIPQTEQWSILTKGTLKLNADNMATIEYLHSDSSNINRVAPTPFYSGIGSLPDMALSSSSPFYPGNGITPAFAGLSGDPLLLNWRSMEAGQRREKDTSKSDRFLLGAEGLMAGWDYKTGFLYAQAQASSHLTNGYLKDAGVTSGINNGIINPFGPQNAAGQAYLDSIGLSGELYNGTSKRIGVDLKASREFGQLAGGAMGVAVGTELAHESAVYNVNREVADQASATGAQDAQDVSGSRNISAIFGEFTAPITKEVELQLAARYDYYNDVGGAFNPKIGVRYQPTKELLFRASANTGFRAPTLFEKYSPNSTTNTANNWDDPLLCPNGTAVPGQNPNVVCNAQQQIRGGGNPDLNPEKAKNFSIGFVVEPNKMMSLSADYWNLKITDRISVLPDTVIFGNPTKYADLFVRNTDGSLKYVLDTNANLGGANTDGVDISAVFRFPKTGYGIFAINMDGTYVNKYEYQNEKDGAWVQNVGTYGDVNPVFRWKHTLSINWNYNAWSSTLSQQFMTGYHDQNEQVASPYYQDVPSYTTWALTGTYTGFKNIKLTAGVKNLFDKAPPFSNQGTTFQQGYDPRFTNAVGRALYVRGTYRF